MIKVCRRWLTRNSQKRGSSKAKFNSIKGIKFIRKTIAKKGWRKRRRFVASSSGGGRRWKNSATKETLPAFSTPRPTTNSLIPLVLLREYVIGDDDATSKKKLQRTKKQQKKAPCAASETERKEVLRTRTAQSYMQLTRNLMN